MLPWAALGAAMTAVNSGVAWAQPAFVASERLAVRRWSGVQANPSDAEVVAYATTIEAAAGTPWVRLRFGDCHLDEGSYLRITSSLDNHVQHLHAEHLEQWRHSSAYFNGAAVTVELIAGAHSRGNHLAIAAMEAGLPTGGGGPDNICGTGDERVPSNEPSVGRLLPVGCTGTIYSPAGCCLTAGHCQNRNQVMEFNVPPSDPLGNIQHPPPRDQYAVDPDSKAGLAGGIGNDWGHFTCFRNSETGLSPYEAQLAWTRVADELPVHPVFVRLFGYGVSDIPERNQVQQLSMGPVVMPLTLSVGHQADTGPGSSGTAIVDVATGRTIGIHTHGGCGNHPKSFNSGTLITTEALQARVAMCQSFEFVYPEGLVEFVDPLEGTELVVRLIERDPNADPAMVTLYVSGDDGAFMSIPMTGLGHHTFSGVMPAARCGSRLRYYVEVIERNGVPVADPPGAPQAAHTAFAASSATMVIRDDFETNRGWTATFIGGSQTTGQWERVDPIGTGAQPENDFSADGTMCYVTGNCTGSIGACDVDEGPVVLTSPTLDLSGEGQWEIRYALWFYNGDETDRIDAEISNDGGASFRLLESVGPGGLGIWQVRRFIVSDFLEPTNRVVVRFITADIPNDSITEAAVDEFVVMRFDCDG